MLLEQRTPLTLGHPAPDPELDTVVECVCSALHEYRAVPTDSRRFALRRTSNEELVWIRPLAPRLRNPSDTCFCFFYI